MFCLPSLNLNFVANGRRTENNVTELNICRLAAKTMRFCGLGFFVLFLGRLNLEETCFTAQREYGL